MKLVYDDDEWKICSVQWMSFISYLFVGFLLRSDLLISSRSRPLLLAAKSRFNGYLFFMFHLFCLTILLWCQIPEYLKLLRCNILC